MYETFFRSAARLWLDWFEVALAPLRALAVGQEALTAEEERKLQEDVWAAWGSHGCRRIFKPIFTDEVVARAKSA